MENQLNKGIKSYLNDDAYQEPFSLEKLEAFLLKRFKSRQRKICEPHYMPYEEAQGIFGTQISREEYENSTGLYMMSDGSITGLGGWNKYWKFFEEALKRKLTKYDKNDKANKIQTKTR